MLVSLPALAEAIIDRPSADVISVPGDLIEIDIFDDGRVMVTIDGKPGGFLLNPQRVVVKENGFERAAKFRKINGKGIAYWAMQILGF